MSPSVSFPVLSVRSPRTNPHLSSNMDAGTRGLLFLDTSVSLGPPGKQAQLDADTGLPWCDEWGTRKGLPWRDQRDNPRKRLTWRDLAGVAGGCCARVYHGGEGLLCSAAGGVGGRQGCSKRVLHTGLPWCRGVLLLRYRRGGWRAAMPDRVRARGFIISYLPPTSARPSLIEAYAVTA